MLSLSALMVMPASVVCCTWRLVLTFCLGVLRKPVCIRHWFTKGCRCGCLSSFVAYHKRRKEVCSQNSSVFKGCHRNISSTRTINLHLTKEKPEVGGQPTLYINIVEPHLDKTSFAGRHVANSFYFLLLILHGPSTRQKKLSAAITTKEKPTPDVRDDASKSRRNTQNTYTTLPVYTLHTFPLFACVCVARPERKQVATQ
jgi:hypothetical protein